MVQIGEPSLAPERPPRKDAVNLIVKVRMLFVLPPAGSGRVFNPKTERPRWDKLDSHPVTHGVVMLTGSLTGLVGVLDVAGQVVFDVAAIPSGRYKLYLQPAIDRMSIAPAGPDHNNHFFDLRRQARHRSLSVELTLGIGDIATVKAAGIDEADIHGAVSFASNTIIVDWKPDWIAAKDVVKTAKRKKTFAVVVHHTAATDMNSLNEALSGNGAHYYIDVDGHAVKLYNEDVVAPHAGYSYWKGEKSVNEVSVGIELVNLTEPYPDAQIVTLIRLLRAILAHEKLDRHAVIGHADVAADKGTSQLHRSRRVVDPGPEFPWKRLADEKLTSWPWPNTTADLAVVTDFGGYFRDHPKVPAKAADAALLDASKRPYGVIAGVQRGLSTIGYSIHHDGTTVTGVLDEATTIALDRFRRHYMDRVVTNDQLNGVLDRDTVRAIKRVVADRNEMVIPPTPVPPSSPPPSPSKAKSPAKSR